MLYYETPYSYYVCSLTNESTVPAYYSLTLYDYEGMTVVQAYDAYGNPIIDFNPESFAVESGETIYLLLIADSVRWYLGYECSFVLSELDYVEYVYDGVLYYVRDDYATIAGLVDDRFVYDIPTTLSVDGNSVLVDGVEESFLYDYAINAQIFYAESWDMTATTLQEYGFVVVCLADTSTVAGDLDGSGAQELDDVILMNAWLTETAGVRVNEANLLNMDLNSDGILDYNDLVLLIELIY